MRDQSNKLGKRIALLSKEKRALLARRIKTPLRSGHELVAMQLKQLGITHVYSISGAPIDETLAACCRIGIRAIGVRHQQAGVMMAVAQNYTAGRLTAVAILSAGPAITNATTAILVAYDNCWPLVVLGGRRPLHMQGMGCFQELDAIPVFKSITKCSAIIESTERIPATIRQAYRTAVSGRPGPVYLDIPEDIITQSITEEDMWNETSLDDPAGKPASESIRQALDIICGAKRPLMIIGKGVRWSEPYLELQQLATEHGIPFITSPMGRGFLPDDHPLCFNAIRSQMQAESDVVILLGARLDYTFRYGSEFAEDARLIHIEIDAGEIGRNVTPAVGLVGDVKQILCQLLRGLGDASFSYQYSDAGVVWIEDLNKQRGARLAQLEKLAGDNNLPMSPCRMIKEIRDFLPRNAICVIDGNVIMAAAQQLLPSFIPASRLTSASNGCLGVGIPFGLGAKMEHPQRLTVIISGDTAAGFNIMELETAVRHELPVILIVANNQGNSGALKQKALYPGDYPERVTMFGPDVRYEKICEALGGHGEYVQDPAELKDALKRAVESGKPACINVRIDPNARIT